MHQKKIVLILIFFTQLCSAQVVKYKIMHMLPPNNGQYRLNIINIPYDSTVSDTRLVQCIDTMPGYLFGAKTYDFLYKGDTTKRAIQLLAGIYFFHKKFTLHQFWKNGNKLRVDEFNKHYEMYWHFGYWANDAPMECGKYKHGKKVGKWRYFNTMGLKIKVEKYAHDGTLKKTKTFKLPKNCARTIFNPRHPGGTPYIITEG